MSLTTTALFCCLDGFARKALFARLWQRGLHLLTGIRKNMKKPHAALGQAVVAQAFHHRDTV